jgi:hypothetical protein
VGRDSSARMSNQAKSAIWMWIGGRPVGVDDFNCREEPDQQQADDAENFVSEAFGTRLGSRLEHQILNV